MEEKKENQGQVIDLFELCRKIFSHKKLFLKVWVVTFILSCIWIVPQPRSYMSSVSLVPESEEGAASSLSSIASSFGFNIGNNESSDAYYPLLYPDVIASNEFIINLLQIPVATSDEPNVRNTYYYHLTKGREKNILTAPFKKAKKKVSRFIKEMIEGSKPKKEYDPSGKIDPFRISEEDLDLIEALRNEIICDVDKKTMVITITVWDQDALVAAEMADSIRVRLQQFIVDYRTSKVRNDMEHYQKVIDKTYKEYQTAMQKYNKYCDSHMNTVMQSSLSERSNLENEMSLALNSYNTAKAQYQLCKAKVLEKTPAFTTLQKPFIAIRPMRPKRMLFVIAMLFLSTIATIGYIFKKEIKEQLTHLK